MQYINRRKFLKTGSLGLAGITFIPSFLPGNILKAFSYGNPINDYYDHFGVTEKIIQDVMGEALSRGAEYCDIYFENSISNVIGLEDKIVNRANSSVGYGVGIRALKGDQTGYSYTEDLSPEAMKLAAKTAANIANDSKSIPPQKLNFRKPHNFYPIKTEWENVSIEQKIPHLQTINDKMFALDTRVMKSRVFFVDGETHVLIANSDGIVTYDYRPTTTLYASCTAEQNGVKEQNSFNLSGRYGIEFFTDERIDRIAGESVRRTVNQFEAVKPEAGEMEMIMAAGSSGILLHEAIGHGMEADFNRKNISIYSDKIDKPVAESFVTIVDDATNPNIRGSLNVDDEGGETELTYMVKNGILKSYLHDRISAKHYGIKPTGNGRRQSYKHTPMPRMRNTYMLNGPHTRNEIIASTKKGIYAEQFTNGQVFIGAGDFTFYVKSGYLIEDGKFTRPIKDVNIIGNGPDILKKVNMVGNDMKLAEGGWNCGKNGQSIPVSMGLPTVKVSSITVGGVNS
jgi:TldD protein